jgi:maltose alpha-D-glucosyltransferase/alpha-amylase
VLLAEANGTPDEVAEYFGDDDECQLAMHFPLMPQLFLAVAAEWAQPISQVLAATPEPPPNSAWATFLRNHDELSLETVTDHERQQMYEVYCPDERMRANVGIRRRLAPLLEHRPEVHLLLTSLLLSLPGTPILYYGDEIGMGDNIWLEDRDAVRTPMQWTARGGFSDNPVTYYPVNDSPLHGPDIINVETQQDFEGSLLRRTRKALLVRREHRALQSGAYLELATDNPKVLAFLRVLDDDAVLCINSFAATTQSVSVELGEWAARTPVSVDGEAFPADRDGRLALTLEPHAVLWLPLAPAVPDQPRAGVVSEVGQS